MKYGHPTVTPGSAGASNLGFGALPFVCRTQRNLTDWSEISAKASKSRKYDDGSQCLGLGKRAAGVARCWWLEGDPISYET